MKVARIAVLGIALAAGGIAAFLASGSGEAPPPLPVAPVVKLETTEVLVAKTDIGLGSRVLAPAMEWQSWPAATANPIFIRKSDRPDAIENLAGSIARAPFSAGEPIREAKLIKANGSSGYMAAILPAGMRAISPPVSAAPGAGGFILPNDHVDVILTHRDKAAEKAAGVESLSSNTILSNVRVLAIDQAVEEKNGERVVVGRTATLELSPAQAETLTLSQQLGTLSLALRSIVDFEKSTTEPVPEAANRKGGVNMVRFGVSTVTSTK